MKQHLYSLEKYKGTKTRHDCPICKETNVFTRYVNNESNESLNYKVGKCNRINKCGYHYPPKDYFENNNINFEPSNKYKYQKPIPKPITSYINNEVLRKSLVQQQSNNFIDYLASIWDYETAYQLADKYNIGTSKHWNGATIFWQQDKNNRIRTGKIMLYNSQSGKRIK